MRLCLAIAFALAACGGSSKKPAPAPPAENTVAEEAPPPEEEEAPPEEETEYVPPPVDQASLDAGGVGAPACDELIVRTRCMYAKTPGTPPEAMKAFDDAVGYWRDAILNDATRGATVDACKMSLDAGHAGFDSLGC